jgi:hypothetical protein
MITSCNERDHAILKRQLRFSNENFKIVINKINLLLNNHHHEYLIAFEEMRTRYSFNLRKSIYRYLIAFVFSYVFKRIDEQYALLIN